MRTFLDSSAFAKRFVEEAGSDAVERLCEQVTELGLSVLCVPEIISALNRRVREGSVSRDQYLEAKARLAAEVAEATIVNLLPAVIARAIGVLETTPLRALDAVHVACALQWKADLFVSSDDRQLGAAAYADLRTMKV
ncbi:MAG: type II toxin-antitoxin system VapC family toxin [Trueperaceae bacterium]|nr:type II toxin-antitoxin system VapC family toxin [Trueperaceae bacterium]